MRRGASLSAMASPKNLTGQITRLRDRQGGFLSEDQGTREAGGNGAARVRPKPPQGRPLAADYFMWFSYALLAAAIVTQLGLVLWLDLL